MTDLPLASQILARVRAVPEGFVTTYGDLCREAPRFAGAVMAGSDDPSVPWHRVVRADGSITQGDRQRDLLIAEGVPMQGQRVDMDEAWVDIGGLTKPDRGGS